MDRHHDAARLLLSARRDPTQRLHSLPEAMRPKTEAQAYLIQRAIITDLGGIGGWKVGSPGPDGPVNCAPLPAAAIQDSPATITGSDRLVEAEIALRLAHDLPPRDPPYTRAEVLAAIASAHPAIEVLQTRYLDVAAVDPLSALADSLSHFGLVVGPAIPGWQSLDLAAETVRLSVNGPENGAHIKTGAGNPAGDMIRMVLWLANEGAHWAGGLYAGQVVTTGSWTGKDPVPPGGEARIRFDHAGEATVRFTP